jgi:hypothetical protein
MTEEQIVERFEEIQDEIDVYTKRIETLEEDVEILAKFATSQIIATEELVDHNIIQGR